MWDAEVVKVNAEVVKLHFRLRIYSVVNMLLSIAVSVTLSLLILMIQRQLDRVMRDKAQVEALADGIVSETGAARDRAIDAYRQYREKEWNDR